VLALALLAAAFFLARRRDPVFRAALSRRLLRLPQIGALVAKVETERLTLLLGTMVAAGVALPTALSAAREAASNAALRLALGQSQRAIERGERLAASLAASGVVPPLALELLRVGEETGDLAPMLLKASDMLRKEIEATASEWIALVAPISLLILGLMVGLIALALFGTVLDVYDFAS
jgi:general secretion pathway protein F